MYYTGKKRRNCYSRVHIGMTLGLYPFCRLVKHMPKHLLTALAQETRERFLIAEKLFSCPYPIENIDSFNWDAETHQVVVAMKDPDHCTPCTTDKENHDEFEWTAVTETIPPIMSYPGPGHGDGALGLEWTKSGKYNPYFAYGNTVVLNWGQIIPGGHFHNRQQLFPLGFKCVRQELDVKLNRLVDCFCEIDYTIVQSNKESTSKSSGKGASEAVHKRIQSASLEELVTKHRSLLRPLFRISVAWNYNASTTEDIKRGACDVKTVVKVYEGRTPQLAWQSVMLEYGDDTLGQSTTVITDAEGSEVEKKEKTENSEGTVVPTDGDGSDATTEEVCTLSNLNV